MKNLENYGVQEMNTKEMVSIDGGFFGLDDSVLITLGIGMALGVITTQDLDDLADAFMEGYNSTHP